MVRHVVEDEVEAVPVSGEVFTCVIDDMVSADRADHLYVPRATHAGHLAAERFADLHGECTDAPRATVDQDLLPWLALALVAKNMDCGGRVTSHAAASLEGV